MNYSDLLLFPFCSSVCTEHRALERTRCDGATSLCTGHILVSKKVDEQPSPDNEEVDDSYQQAEHQPRGIVDRGVRDAVLSPVAEESTVQSTTASYAAVTMLLLSTLLLFLS